MANGVPYCNKELSHLEDSLSLITSKGATVLAITPEQPAYVEKTIDKTQATYSILTDDNLKIMKDYDVAFAVDPTTIENTNLMKLIFPQPMVTMVLTFRYWLFI